MARVRIYAVNVLIGLDVTACAICGGQRYMTISGTIGKSIKSGGFWSHVRLPAWFRNHCLSSDYTAEV